MNQIIAICQISSINGDQRLIFVFFMFSLIQPYIRLVFSKIIAAGQYVYFVKSIIIANTWVIL